MEYVSGGELFDYIVSHGRVGGGALVNSVLSLGKLMMLWWDNAISLQLLSIFLLSTLILIVMFFEFSSFRSFGFTSLCSYRKTMLDDSSNRSWAELNTAIDTWSFTGTWSPKTSSWTSIWVSKSVRAYCIREPKWRSFVIALTSEGKTGCGDGGHRYCNLIVNLKIHHMDNFFLFLQLRLCTHSL